LLRRETKTVVGTVFLVVVVYSTNHFLFFDLYAHIFVIQFEVPKTIFETTFVLIKSGFFIVEIECPKYINTLLLNLKGTNTRNI
jgi:hypothetical protein